ncbi:MAG: hypothetical protein KAI61_03990, partial [Alphaproteobacteria bacterium]|nr:hypothetical protein [Alphaproteobacteria bacterium]
MKCKCQTEPEIEKKPVSKPLSALWISGTILSLCVWALLYSQLVPFSKWIVAQLPIEQTGHLYEALTFFFYDTP